MSTKEQPIVIPEEIHLIGIKVIKSNLNLSDNLLDSSQKIEDLQFGIGHELGYNIENEQARIRIFITLNSDKNDSHVEAEYGVEFHFEVNGLKKFTKNEGDEIALDMSLAATLFGMAYSTTRGIVLERTQGTMLGGIIIPVIDVFKVINEESTV